MTSFRIGESDSGKRVDIVISNKYPEFSRSSLEKLFDAGHVHLNGKPVKASHKLHVGDKINVDETLLSKLPPDLELPVIYEDEDVLVINKPEGILTHAKGSLNTEASVASFIKPKLQNFALSNNRAGIVHRLDRATSGIIITAKNTNALSKLQKQFSLRKARKQYIAIVHGRVSPDHAIIDAAILRNPAKPQTFKVDSSGKSAITEYMVLQHLTKGGKDYTYLQLSPKTGRTHQLRVHMNYIGHSIVGDNVYGKDSGELLLHAVKLEITLPSSERKIFDTDVPKRFNEFLYE